MKKGKVAMKFNGFNHEADRFFAALGMPQIDEGRLTDLVTAALSQDKKTKIIEYLLDNTENLNEFIVALLLISPLLDIEGVSSSVVGQAINGGGDDEPSLFV